MGIVLVISSCSKIEIEESDYKIQREGNVVLLYNNIDSLIINLHEATLVDTLFVTDTLSADDVLIMRGLHCCVSDIKEVRLVNTFRNVSIIEKEIAVELSVSARNDKENSLVNTTFSFSREMLTVKTGKRIEECFSAFQFKVTPHLTGYIEDLNSQNPYCIALYDFDIEILENTKLVGNCSFSRSFVVERDEILFLPTVEDWEYGNTGTIDY